MSADDRCRARRVAIGAAARKKNSQLDSNLFSLDSKRIGPISFTVSTDSSATTMSRRVLPDPAALGRAAVPASAC